MGRKKELRELKSETLLQEATIVTLQERLADLEFALYEEGWQKLTVAGERELSREAVQTIAGLARAAYLKNPLVRRSVDVQSYYVWALGWNIQAADDDVNKVIQDFLDDPKNQDEISSQQARILKEVDLQLTGNIFFTFFTHPVSGRVRVRTIPPDEVQDILTNPEDRRDPWFYKRTWTSKSVDLATGNPEVRQQTAYYPDWRYTPVDRIPKIGDYPVMWEAPVYHVKTGGTGEMLFGIPEVYPQLDWAKAVTRDLEDYATVKRSLARFSWLASAGNSKTDLAALRARMGGSDGRDVPLAGSVFAATEGRTLQPIKTAGGQASPEEGRRMWLMVASAAGLPETFYGDAQAGSLATARSLDRPTELKMRNRQALWSSVYRAILRYVVERAALAPTGPLAGRGTFVPDDDGEQVVELGELDARIDVVFPDILERDPEQRIRAIIEAATLAGREPVGTLDDRTMIRLLLDALGVQEIDELLDQLAPQDGESLIAQRRADRAETAASIAGQQQDQQQAEARLTEAMAMLRARVEAERQLQESVQKIRAELGRD